MYFNVCGRTDKGLSRPTNEDRYIIAESPYLFAVADGMGGHAAGEIASQIAIDAILYQIKKAAAPPERFIGDYNPHLPEQANRLLSAIRLANQLIYQAGRDNAVWRGMGTTIAVAWPITKNRLVIGHVGDSRIYLIRENVIKQLTTDHSIIEEQIRQGLLTKKEAARSQVKNIITRSLGNEEQVVVDVNVMDIKTGDILLLCTDGLTSMVEDETILSLVNTEDKLANRCGRLIETAIQKGGKDNVAVILAELLEQDSC